MNDPTALIVPTAEWIDPYVDLTDEQKAALMSEVEPPPNVPIGPECDA